VQKDLINDGAVDLTTLTQKEIDALNEVLK
jgi:hypothetical protein